MRKSTIEVDMTGSTVEHVEVWVDEPSPPKDGNLKRGGSSPAKRKPG